MIHIRAFQNTTGDYEALARIKNRVWHEPIFSPDELSQWDTERPPKFVHHRFLAQVANQVVGAGTIEQNPNWSSQPVGGIAVRQVVHRDDGCSAFAQTQRGCNRAQAPNARVCASARHVMDHDLE